MSSDWVGNKAVDTESRKSEYNKRLEEVKEKKDSLLEDVGYGNREKVFVYTLKVRSEDGEILYYVGVTNSISTRLKAQIKDNLSSKSEDYEILSVEDLKCNMVLPNSDKELKTKRDIMEREVFIEKMEKYGPENVVGGK